MPGGRFTLLLELVKVDTLLLFRFGWSRLFSGFLGTIGNGDGGIGKDISGEEDNIGTDLSEFWGSNNQAGDSSERLDSTLRVLGQLLSGYRGGSSVDVDINVGVGSIVLS